ncbi:hypothetical protein EON66_08345, partial [archaeon]
MPAAARAGWWWCRKCQRAFMGRTSRLGTASSMWAPHDAPSTTHPRVRCLMTTSLYAHVCTSARVRVCRDTGLKRMSRRHIHCAAGMAGADGVISGMRTSANVFIFIDTRAALAEGVPIYRSTVCTSLPLGATHATHAARGVVTHTHTHTHTHPSKRAMLPPYPTRAHPC